MNSDSGLSCWRGEVLAEWVDYNGHLRDAFYLLIFSHATDGLMDYIGLDAAGRSKLGHTLFTLETHLNYLREVKEGSEVHVKTWILDMDAKRVRVYHELYRDEQSTLLAANEQLLVNIDIAGPKSVPFDSSIESALRIVMRQQPEPDHQCYAGRQISLVRRG